MHPALVRRVVYPVHERALGRPTFAYLAALERSQWASREAIEELQLAKLRCLLRDAARHCPWHAARLAAAGLPAGEGLLECGLDALWALPPVTKADMRAHAEDGVWRGVPGGAQIYATGGSTGEPLIFHFGRARQASDAAGRMRARRWWGVEVGEPEVYLWGAPAELGRTDRVKRLRDRLCNQLVLNAFEMSEASMREYVAAIRAYAPRCVYGYASSLALLAAYARDRGARLRSPRLRVVCATGEPLLPFQRALLEDEFGVAVANEFGSRDIGFTAHEAPGGEMLLLSESILLEVLDEAGRPVPPGELGEAVMTGLCSQAQPFVRYRTGDMVRLSPRPASGGRGLHVLAEVVGRQTDFLVRPDGTWMHALAGIYVVRETPGVAQFRIIQHDPREVEVQVVPDRAWTEASAERIRRGLARRFGEGVAVHVALADAIPLAASGKHRYVESRVAGAGASGDLARYAAAGGA